MNKQQSQFYQNNEMSPRKTCIETRQDDGTWMKGEWTEHELHDPRGYENHGEETYGPESLSADGVITRPVTQNMKLIGV